MTIWAWHDSPASTGDPLTIDTRDFFALPFADRQVLATWLWPITGHGIGGIERIRLGEGSVVVTTIDFHDDGCPVRDGRDGYATTDRCYDAPVPPPVWKPLR